MSNFTARDAKQALADRKAARHRMVQATLAVTLANGEHITLTGTVGGHAMPRSTNAAFWAKVQANISRDPVRTLITGSVYIVGSDIMQYTAGETVEVFLDKNC